VNYGIRQVLESTGVIEILAEHRAEDGPGGLPKLLPAIELVYGLSH
jgi:radical SAM superfamily enzyme with C-terminal helix-hairpin-helix motif